MTDILDKGYLKLVETWGSDSRIIEAARMSTGGGFRGWDKDQRLLEYLYRNHHDTPFEMAGMIIEVKAPIFVFREWHRHRTQSYNEMSARYIQTPDEVYLPSVRRIQDGIAEAGSNKQAGGIGSTLSFEEADAWIDRLSTLCDEAEEVYEEGLQLGIPREIARCAQTVNRYSVMRASANLRNWLGFMTLRTAVNAQWEIRQYANEVAALVKEQFPRTYNLWEERVNG